MQFNSAKSFPPRRKSHWQTLAIILVFLLLALAIWKWFDYQIARLSFPQREGSSGTLIHSDNKQSDSVKTLRHE